jgi:3-methyladenine DNA glycosylase AlkD
VVTYAAVHRRLAGLASAGHAKVAQWFFKTGPGQYGEGDRFLGIKVPALRVLVCEYSALPLTVIVKLLHSPWHEERLFAVLMLVRMYGRGTEVDRNAIFRLYMQSLDRINNWDIVDSSAPQIVGRHLGGRGRATLIRLSRAGDVWSRRVAVVATQHDIRQGRFNDILVLAKRLLNDQHDLIHKAVGWMLREVGNRDEAVLTAFLDRHAAEMPRTMLRYAIEKLPSVRRKAYLKKDRA